MILFNKPYGVLCQFTGDGTRPTLSDYIDVPDVYPAGRLDADSEGLVVLTGDGALQARIADPRTSSRRPTGCRSRATPDAAQLATLARGVELDDGPTRPAKRARIAGAAGAVAARSADPRAQGDPDRWLELVIREGRNRQVRRMTAAVGLPTLRLVRWAVGAWTLDGLAPGAWRREESMRAVL